jgi:hypothetical protein
MTRPALALSRPHLVHRGHPWWLRPFLKNNVAAITLGRHIWVPAEVDEVALELLLRHELVHVEQQARLGVVSFLFRYVQEYTMNRLRGMSAEEAYRHISFEEEAFAAERRETV